MRRSRVYKQAQDKYMTGSSMAAGCRTPSRSYGGVRCGRLRGFVGERDESAGASQMPTVLQDPNLWIVRIERKCKSNICL